MIQVRALRHAHRGGPELRFPDWEVAQGGMALLRGPSGSGKSTLLAVLAGLVDVQHGQVVVAGTGLGSLSGAARDRWRGRTLGFLPQRLALSDALTVRQNLQLASLAAGLPHDPAMLAALAAALGLDGLLERRPATLSGGQAQRVALARALVNRPRVILADEPTASLDDAAALATVDLLRDAAAREGVTLVLATHDARVLARFQHHGDLVRLVDLPALPWVAPAEVAA